MRDVKSQDFADAGVFHGALEFRVLLGALYPVTDALLAALFQHGKGAGVGLGDVGAEVAEFAAEWWKWSQSVPDDQDPVKDETGRHCAIGQRGSIWFLAGGYDSSRKQRACEVPAGKYIFFPVINSLAWRRAQDRHFSCADAKRRAAIADDRTVELFVTQVKAAELKELQEAMPQIKFDVHS